MKKISSFQIIRNLNKYWHFDNPNPRGGRETDLDELLGAVVHLVVPLNVGYDARHVHLALERRRLSRPGRHIVHYVLNVGFAARPD